MCKINVHNLIILNASLRVSMAAIHTADILTTWSGRGELLIFLIINMNHVPKDIYWILALLGQVKQTCNMQLDRS